MEQYSHSMDGNVDAVLLLLFGLRFSTCEQFERHPKYDVVNDVMNGVNEFEESNSIIR